MKTTSWKLIKAFTNGHRFFEDEKRRIAVGDQSGSIPEHTDDGILWLDTTRPIFCTPRIFALPLTYPSGRQTHTPISEAEACYCIRYHDFKVQIGGIILTPETIEA